MRTTMLALLVLLITPSGCDPQQDLGDNDPASGAGTSAAGKGGTSQAGSGGSGQAGNAVGQAGGGVGPGSSGSGGSGGSNTVGQAGGGGMGAGSGAGGSDTVGQAGGGGMGVAGNGAAGQLGGGGMGPGGGAAVACPPAAKAGVLTAVPTILSSLIYPWDLRMGKSDLLVLQDPLVALTPLGPGDTMGGSFSLPFNEGYRAIGVLSGKLGIPSGWASASVLESMDYDTTGETIVALKTGLTSYSEGEQAPGLVTAGTDVYWTLPSPPRVVEASLGAEATEHVLAAYDAASGTIPMGIDVDDTYVYWTATSAPDGGPEVNEIYRARRHDPTATPEKLASTTYAMNTILVDGDSLHVGYTPGAAYAGGTMAKGGGGVFNWGGTPSNAREGRLAALDGYVYYTELQSSGCGGRLLRHKIGAQNAYFTQGEVLIEAMKTPSSLLVHEGKLYFTTAADLSGEPSSGAVFSYAPPATETCTTCGQIYASGAKSAVCGPSEKAFLTLFTCASGGSCSQVCPLPQDALLPDSCKACIEQNCAGELAACQADTGT